MANLVHNERVKYTATFLNTIAIACVVVGVVTPVQQAMANPLGVPLWALAVAGGWLLVGAVLHLGVRRLLGRLRE